GYYYEQSPLIVSDGEAAPPSSMGGFTASTAPGARVPHFTLADGRSLYDAFGQGYTLLRFDLTVDVTALLKAARISGVPIELLDVTAVSAPAVYRHKLLLARPDQHVAWRGDHIQADPEALINAIRGVDTIRV
ncbi:MAG TPA: monooxygenase, partial [Bradyrhizobium sp.]|nr:monooxygenase [Bradyrhizobium sp.]